MQIITAHLKPNGKLDIRPELFRKLIDKEFKIIYEIEPEGQKEDVENFYELLKNGPKISGGPEHITREWIHDRGEDDIRYR